MDANETHALAAVREGDRDRYLSILYGPQEKRGALAALYAFNLETARIRDLIREPMPGEIRLQWWRDALAAASEGDGHPIAAALRNAISEYNLPLPAFENHLEARIFDLYDDPMPSRTDLEGYCGETASTLIQLAALVLDSAAAEQHADLAGHAGCAQAIAGLLRLLPIHRARGECYVPLDILAAAGTTRDEFVAGSDRESAGRAIAATIALAREHYAAFSAGAAAMPRALRPAFLPVAPVPAYLNRLARIDPLAEVADISPLRRQWLIMRRAAWGWR
jgi:phytoene synthase